MRLLITLMAFVCACAAGAQSYAVSEIPSDFVGKNIASIGTGLTTSLVTPGTSTPDTDDGVAGPVPLYFSFPFFGTGYSECYVSANGFLSFEPLTSSHPTPPAAVPGSAAPNNFIAPLWKDLGRNPLSLNSSCVLYYTDIGSSLGQWEFRVQWSDWPDQGQTASTAMNSVVVCMYQATGIIEIHFGPLAPSYNFCCGVENAGGTAGFASPAGWTVTAAPSKAYRFEPVAAALQIDTANPLPDGTEGVAYAQQFQASGGTAPYYWYDASGSGGLPLPAGWSIDVDGNLTAAAQDVVAGTYQFDITLSDSTATGLISQRFSVTINPASGGGGGGGGTGSTPAQFSGSGGGNGGCSSGPACAPWLLLMLLGATLYRRRRA